MSDFLLNIAFGWVPWWAWAALALLLAGAVYRWVGWQGLAALALGVAAFFGYRQGWRDHGDGKKPAVPIEDFQEPIAPKPRQRTIFDMFKRK